MEEKIKNMLRIFLDSIRDYEHECGDGIYKDERSSSEFVEIFINSEDAFNYHELIKNLPNELKGVSNNENMQKKCNHKYSWNGVDNGLKCIYCGHVQ